MYKPTPLFGPKTVQRGGGGGLYSVVYGIYVCMYVCRERQRQSEREMGCSPEMYAEDQM